MKKTKKFIWDYDISKINFDDPEVMKWYLKRKIDFCDWEALDQKNLQKYLPVLDIDPSMKQLLSLFLKNEKSSHTGTKKLPGTV